MEAVTVPLIEIDGRPATAAALAHPALVNYGHLTVMQVRDGRTRGLGLHLSRLDEANRELFGEGLDGDRVRGFIRHALGDVRDASVRVSVFWPDDAASIMVVVRPPVPEPDRPQRLRTVVYERPVAHVKHLGTFGQIYHGRQTERAGFDEALLVDRDGVVSEGSITNLGCHDGASVVWPDAPALHGITMRLLEGAVPSRRARVRVADLASYEAVFVTNSRGIAAVERVDDLALPVSAPIMKTLTEAYASVPWDVI